jgi:hypothetical protein
MPRTILLSSSARIVACALALLLVSACQNVPKYKRSNGKFNEWSSYEGKNFSPSRGTVAAVDTAANSVTIIDGKNTKVFTVTPATRIMHEGADITLAQLPLHQEIKFTMADDRKQLLTIWYGVHLDTFHRPVVQKAKNSLF